MVFTLVAKGLRCIMDNYVIDGDMVLLASMAGTSESVHSV